MPIEESPVFPWETYRDIWAKVEVDGANGDGVTNDSAAVQAAGPLNGWGESAALSRGRSIRQVLYNHRTGGTHR